MNHLKTINWQLGQRLLKRAARARVAVMLWGNPGVGKTALAYWVAKEIQRPLHVIIGSTLDPTDVGGLPYVDREKNDFIRWPMRAIREAAKTPSVIFIDELTSAPRIVAAALMRLVLEGWAGDVQVHPDTIFILAANPPEIAASGSEVSAPEVNRWAGYWFEPSYDEILNHFRTAENLGGYTGDDDYLQRLAALCHEWAATVSVEPGLIQMVPPEASINEGAAWASPRANEHMLRMIAAETDGSYDEEFSAAAGCVGSAAAQTFLSVRKLRRHLPTRDDVLKDPSSATVPQTSYQLAAIGLLAQVARIDSWAAWVYAARLDSEMANACATVLFKYPNTSTDSPHAEAGDKAQIKLLGDMGKAVGV